MQKPIFPRICALFAALALVHCHSSCGDSDATDTPVTQQQEPTTSDSAQLAEHARLADPGRRPLALHRFALPAPSATPDAASSP